MNKVLIYSAQESSRFCHTLEVIFKHVLCIDYTLVSKNEIMEANDTIKINYSNTSIADCFQIHPHSLLFEKKIKEQSITIDWEESVPFFFKTSEKATFNYDLFAMVFYMTSRYEEYLDSELDDHGRFQAENSLAYKNNFLELPVVHLWIAKFQKKIEAQFSERDFSVKKYKYINSIDIDIAYAYRGKKKSLLLASSLKNILTLNFQELNIKLAYFFKNQQDPYDTYAYINKLKNKYKSNNLFFFLLGDYGKYDKNLSYKSNCLRLLIQKIEKSNAIGIHPSYNSNLNQSQLKKEINNLALITGNKIFKSRQHFLKLSLPSTYENLIAQGIKEDYSMGFASRIGFRAGMCTGFPFFNLQTDTTSNLMLYPFQIMDGTLNTYMKLTPLQATKKISEITDRIKEVNGTFISLWHNSSLSDLYEWKNWRTVYEKLQLIAKDS